MIYCHGWNDGHSSAMPALKTPTDRCEISQLQLYWISTEVSNSTYPLNSLIFTITTLHIPTIEPSPISLTT